MEHEVTGAVERIAELAHAGAPDEAASPSTAPVLDEEANDVATRLAAFLARSVFHAYEYRGRRQVVDPVTGVLFTTDPSTHALAIALARAVDRKALHEAVHAAGLERSRTFVSDLERLQREHGMFDRAAMSLQGMIERAVCTFMAHRPRKMMLCVAQTCNLRCVYCYAIEGNYHDEGRVMSLDVAQQSIRYLAARAGPRKKLTVTLFGGEPLINFSVIKELVPWARSWLASIGKAIHFCITTNGTLLTDEVIDFLIHEQFSVMISLDGPKEVQDLTRPNAAGRGSFDAAAPRIQRLLERHPHREIVKVRATMTHHSHDARSLAEFFESFGFQRIGLGANLGFAFHKGPFDLTEQDRTELYESTERLIDEGLIESISRFEKRAYDPLAGSLVALHNERDARGPKVKIPCGVARNDQGIDVDGKVYPCHRYVGMQAYLLGDVHQGVDPKLLRAYYERVFAAYRNCQSCWANHWCSGHCPQYLSDPTGRVFGPDDPACDGLRRGFERTLALYEGLKEQEFNWDRAAETFEV